MPAAISSILFMSVKNILKRFIPRSIYLMKMNRRLRRFKGLTTAQVFSTIYKEDLWGSDGENRYSSGEGTLNKNKKKYIDFLSSFIKNNHVKHVVDLGCGDFYIMKIVLENVQGVHFTGVDIVPELIAYNQQTYGAENINFVCLNAVTDELPKGDLITVRQVLQHLGNEQISQILSRLKSYPYVLISEHLPLGNNVVKNKDKMQGPHIRMYYNSGVFVDAAPFHFPATPVFEYREDCYSLNKTQPAVIRTYLALNPGNSKW